MTVLSIDMSNGRTKLALAQGAHVVSEVRLCPSAALTAERLSVLCADWRFDCVALSSVVPQMAPVVEAFFAARVPVVHVRPFADLPVDFSAYEGCATLGADRIANAVAAAHDNPQTALIVIDAGTATTVDVVLPCAAADGKPRFLGGAIAPGVGTMMRALHGGTSLLPEVPLSLPKHAVGQTTPEALQNGCVRGYRGLIRELLTSMEQECGCALHPVLTGGDAPLLADLLPELGKSDALLTLRGIALCAGNAENC